MDWHARHDAGVSMADNRKHLMQAHPDQTDLIMAWEHRWDEMFDGPVGRMDEVFLAAYDARVPQYAVSNLPAEKWEPLKAMYPYLHYLDEAVISGEEKVIKPDPEIYEITIKRIATPPQETVFIDDRLDNIEAAEAFGFLTIHFTDERKTRSRLRDLGLDIPAI